MRAAVAIVALACAVSCTTAGCARRATPYRFRAPVVAGVRAAEVPRPMVRVAEPGTGAGGPAADAPPRRPRPGAASPAPAEGPIDDPNSQPLTVSPAIAKLYAFVGERHDDATDVDLALRAVAALGVRLSPELAGVSSGEALVELARSRHAFPSADQPLIGDLVVFDAVRAELPASLVGVVVGARGDGTVEFIYLARGVVRRGWLNAAAPSRQRDDDGRVLNTFVRHSEGRDPRDTRYLAGQLLAGYVRIDRLTRR